MGEALQPTYSAEEKVIIQQFMDDAVSFIKSLPHRLNPPIRHLFFPGIYIREIRIPAGGQLVSHIHKTEHAVQLMQGRIMLYDGITATVIQAPYTGRSMPGEQRYGVALENCIWQNIHPTKIKPKDNSDEAIDEAVAKIEKKVIKPYHSLTLIK